MPDKDLKAIKIQVPQSDRKAARKACLKRYFCKCGCPCLAVWLIAVPLVFIGLLALGVYIYLAAKSNAMPETLAAPTTGGPGQPTFKAQLEVSNGLTEFLKQMDDEDGGVVTALKGYFKGLVGPKVSSVTASETSRRARMLTARSLASIDANAVLEFVFDSTDEKFDPVVIEEFAFNLAKGAANGRRLSVNYGSIQDDIAKEIVDAMEAAGANVTVTVGDLSVDYGETVLNCNITKPFPDAALCGGLINDIIERPQIKGLLDNFNLIPGCGVPEGKSPVGFDGRGNRLFTRILCTDVPSPPASLGCAATAVIKAAADEINKVLREQNLEAQCKITTANTTCFHYDEGQEKVCKECGTVEINGVDEITCKRP